MRQILSIMFAVIIGYAVFQARFVPRAVPRPSSATPVLARTSTPPATVYVPIAQRPPVYATPDICQIVRTGMRGNGRPLGGYLWELAIQRHPECFTPAPTPRPGEPPSRQYMIPH